jgi:hypothetical protein
MIRSEDVRFHVPNDIQYDWAETSFFSIYLSEANVTAWTYVVARKGVGAIACDVEAIDRIGRVSLDALYVDFQQHLPVQERFEAFTLPNGFSLKTMNEPRDYQIDYLGVGDTAFHWTVKGLMEPFDIHDAAMDPLASQDPNASGFGSAYANHFDMTAHVVGTATIRGKQYDVDCVTSMDHSWGPRNERGLRPMGWINGNFGEDLAFQTIWSFDPMASGWGQFQLAHGYALVDGEVRGLKAGQIRAARQGPYPSGYETRLVDKEGREYWFTGHTVAQHPWACYSNSLAVFTTTRWHHRGREGFGLAQENWPLDLLTGRRLG